MAKKSTPSLAYWQWLAKRRLAAKIRRASALALR